jgi:hypothetical protein
MTIGNLETLQRPLAAFAAAAPGSVATLSGFPQEAPA